MSAVLALAITIMGCSSDLETCTTVSQMEGQWETLAACDAAIPAVLENSGDLSYPTIVARCDVVASPPVDPRTDDEIVVQAAPGLPLDIKAETVAALEEARSEPDEQGRGEALLVATKDGLVYVRDGVTDGYSTVVKTGQSGLETVEEGASTLATSAADLANDVVETVRDRILPKF